MILEQFISKCIALKRIELANWREATLVIFGAVAVSIVFCCWVILVMDLMTGQPVGHLLGSVTQNIFLPSLVALLPVLVVLWVIIARQKGGALGT